jgi:hypothetical protein
VQEAKGLTAWLMGIEGPNENNITYADAQVSDGTRVSGCGWALDDPRDPTGKYDALWSLARELARLGIEVGLTPKLTLGDAREMGGYDPSDLDGAGSWGGGPGRFSR